MRAGPFPYLLAAVVLVGGGVVAFAIATADDETTGPEGSSRLHCDVVAESGDAVDEFVAALAPGQTACLRDGSHGSEEDIKVTAAGITLSSYPGERATLEGRLWISEGADGVTVENLLLDGRNPDHKPSPTVNASDARFRGNEVTNEHTGICFVLGDDVYGEASGTVIEENRIHDCGELPPTNQHHGIYVAHATGTVIRDNWIYSNADRGIQLYPDADGTVITGNVIDGNGQGIIFGGNGEKASDDNLIEGNVITNSEIRFNVESHWPDDVEGTGNVVRRNCISGGARDDGDGAIQSPSEGFEIDENLIADPLYVDRESDDFRLAENSPCLALFEQVR